MAPKKQPLSLWVSETFFEDNPRFSRRASRVIGLMRKAIMTIPQTIAFVFCNFASTYPRSRSTPRPTPIAPATAARLVIDEWLRHPDTNGERGLPYSDSVAGAISVGESLNEVSDLTFAMKELHRVSAGGGSVGISILRRDVAADPTLVRSVTRDTILFFTTALTDPALTTKAKRLGVSGLFALEEESADSVTLRAIKGAPGPHPTRIDIGCGTQVQPGYSGIDIIPLPGVSIVRDVDKHGLPFSDSTISHVYTAHFLEHTQNLVFVMNEIHRVCCHDAIVDINVPTLLGPYAAADPTHRHLFNARTFSYFEAGKDEYAGIIKGFEILEQNVGFSLITRLRVIKSDGGSAAST